MSDSSWQDVLKPVVLMEQIVVGSLVTGATIFFIMANVLVSQGAFDTGDDETLTGAMNLVLIVFLAAVLLAWIIAPRIIVAKARRKILTGNWKVPEGPYQAQALEMLERTGDAGKLIGAHNTKTLVEAALIEGVTFFSIIAYMITQSTFALGTAITLLIMLVLHFPTRNRVFNWIEDQMQRLKEERSFSGNQ